MLGVFLCPLLQIHICFISGSRGHYERLHGPLPTSIYWSMVVRDIGVRCYYTETEKESGLNKSHICGLTFNSPEVTRPGRKSFASNSKWLISILSISQSARRRKRNGRAHLPPLARFCHMIMASSEGCKETNPYTSN